MRAPVALRAVLHAFAQIFLQRHAGCGALVILALALANPALLAGALFGVLMAHAGAVWLGYPAGDHEDGLYGYNPALLGALLVHLLGLTPVSLATIAAASLASCPLQAWLLNRLRHHGGLPGFTFPFVLIGFVTLLATAPAPAFLASRLQPDASALFGAWLLGIGQVVFIDDRLAAACLVTAVAVANWRDALWLLAGSALGLAIATLLGAPWPDGLAGFNPALAALALAQWRSGWSLPVLGMLAAIAFWLILQGLGLPTLTLPFLLATWLGLLIRPPRRSHSG
ncbi:urea transporter [Pseudomonas stutzeri]|uniref:Transporter n=1 Tax=Stutzerimonas stutzeri TaxID=316 RepID=A0A2N8S5P3_STUST|nr:urea transporter [Stutzerimonas stutzeri]MCQ4296921.1 urea transporter [Stutzerimonas stutzeri]PNF81937.1 transporter [Stutzerimonas stutzeri]